MSERQPSRRPDRIELLQQKRPHAVLTESVAFVRRRDKRRRARDLAKAARKKNR